MSNKSSIMNGRLDSLTGISGVYDPKISGVYNPKQSAIGVGQTNYTIGDMPSYNGDPGLRYDKNYQTIKDYNRSWEYTYDTYPDVDVDVMKQIQDYINKQKAKPVTPSAPAVNTVTVDEKVTRKKMTKSKDVGDGLAEMINELV